MSLRNRTSALSGGLAEARDLLRGRHAGHEAICRVPHPRHGGLGATDRQAPHPKPALHDAYLALLGEGHVGGTDATRSASATPAARTATTASNKSGLFCREDEGRSL